SLKDDLRVAVDVEHFVAHGRLNLVAVALADLVGDGERIGLDGELQGGGRDGPVSELCRAVEVADGDGVIVPGDGGEQAADQGTHGEAALAGVDLIAPLGRRCVRVDGAGASERKANG